MKKRTKRKRMNIVLLLIGSILIVVILTFVMIFNRDHSTFEKWVRDPFLRLQSFIQRPFKGEEQSCPIYIGETRIQALEQDVKALQEQLDLKSTMSTYESVSASVLSRNMSKWFQKVTIDKGSRDGIEKGMAVVTSQGLIGKVHATTPSSSEILLLTASSESFQISVQIKHEENYYYGLLNDYQEETEQFVAVDIPKDAPLVVGDVVMTSGLGGTFPSGLYIGTVKEMKNDTYGISRQITLTSDQDFTSLRYVTIIKKVSS